MEKPVTINLPTKKFSATPIYGLLFAMNNQHHIKIYFTTSQILILFKAAISSKSENQFALFS